MPIKKLTAVLWIFAISFVSSSAYAAGFNEKYAAPFGNMPDIRVENSVRFTYFTNQGDAHGVSQRQHGALLGLMLAREDVFGLEINTEWKRHTESITLLQSDCQGEGRTCELERESGANNQVTLGFVPKYRIATLDWFWVNFSVALKIPLDIHKRNVQLWEVDPGFQFYFLATDWLGIELDLNYMMHITDPEDEAFAPDPSKTVDVEAIKDDDEKFYSGMYSRANFVFKPARHHYLMLFAEGTFWFHSVDSERENQLKQFVQHKQEPKYAVDFDDLRYYANHAINIGGGYRANVGPMEAGIGGYGAVTEIDRRPTWGITSDLRFTF